MRVQPVLLSQMFWLGAFVTLFAVVPWTKAQQAQEKIMGVPRAIQDESKLEVQRLAYSPKLKLLASAPAIYNFRMKPALPIFLWDVRTGRLVRVLPGHGQRIKYLAFTPDGDQLVSGATDGVIVWDPLKGTGDQQRYKALKTLKAWATLTPSGKELVQRDEEANVVTWDAKTGAKQRVLKASKETKNGIEVINELSTAISPDERWVALGAGLANHKIVIWDYKKGSVEATLPHESEFFFLSFSKTGRYLFGGGNEVRKGHYGRGVLDIWDTQSWKLVREIEVDECEVRPVVDLPKEDMVLTVDSLRTPEEGTNIRFRTFVNGYSIKTGERVVSFDTQLAKTGWCTSALHMEDIDAICIGGDDGKISFFPVAEILKHRTKK
jgi:WD40 repeat protein